MRALRPVFITLSFAALVAGCSPSDEDEGFGWKVTEPGTGEPNAASLWPNWAGVRRAYSGGEVTTAVAPTERWGETVIRFQGTDDVRFFRTSEDGVLYDGTARLGQLAPILLVPATVRDGMQWESLGSEGQPLGRFDVSALGVQPTIFGEAPVWRVTQTNLASGNQFDTDYAEGFGPIAANNSTLVSAVIPLEAREPLSVPVRTPVTPLGDGEAMLENFWAANLSLIQPETGPGTLRLGGQIAWFSNLGRGGAFQLAPAVACVEIDG